MSSGRALGRDNDLIIRDGSFFVVTGAAQTIQHVRTRLLFYLEEWFLDTTAGTPWLQEVLTKPANLANVESIIKTRILETPGITRLTEFAMTYEGGSVRHLNVSFGADTEFGKIDGIEELVAFQNDLKITVTING